MASEDSLFARLGGESTISTVVHDFYDAVQKDTRVARFFSDIDMPTLVEHQKMYLTVAFGGAPEYGGKPLREAHSDLGLSEDDFNAVVEDLCDVLASVGVGQGLIEEVGSVLEGVKGDIISSSVKKSTITVVYDLEPEHCELLKRHLQWVVQAVGSVTAVGTIIYDALFNGAGEGKKLFVSPKKVTAFRFITQVQRYIEGSDDVAYLDEELYNMSMRHIAYVTPAQCRQYMPLFINTITNTVKGVLDEEWDEFGEESWAKLLNYVGGMLMRNLTELSGKVHLIRKSWANITSIQTTQSVKDGKKDEEQEEEDEDELESKAKAKQPAGKGSHNFGESLYFNLGVMSPEIAALFKRSKEQLAPLFGEGFGQLTVLISDPMLLNEELYILGIRHLKYGTTPEYFPVFGQAVMVTLRSMLPRDWNWAHEDAWGWLWETCATYLSATIEQGHVNKQLVDDTMDRLVGSDIVKLGAICHQRLFSLSDDVQDFFYKPNTTVAYILERVLFILSTLSHEPISVAHEIRALGMRHIKYNIPPVHFPLLGKSLAYTFSCVLEGFWTDEVENSWMSVFGFVMRCMTRAVNEGTNLVTKAMVNNSVEELSDVLKQAPRGIRDMWLLEVNVSGEILSPLYWALYDGKSKMAEFMVLDLIAIRADRDSYYCGIQNLFMTHPGLIKNFAVLSPNLLCVLFDGLMWRSRVANDGYKRVNYFIRNVYGDPTSERYFDPYQTPLAELCRLYIAELFIHPVTQFVIDLKWTTYMRMLFVTGQLYFLVLILLFMIGYVAFDLADKNTIGYDVAYYTRIILGVFNLLLLLLRQIPRMVIQIQRNQVASLRMGSCRVVIPISLTSPLNLARLTINVLLVISFVADRHIVGTVMDNKQVDRLYSWSTSITVVLMWIIPLDWFYLSISLTSYKVRMVSLMQNLFTSLLIAACLVVGFGCSIVISQPDRAVEGHFVHAHESIAYLFAALSGNYVLEPRDMTGAMEVFFVTYSALACLFLLNMTSALFTTVCFLQNDDLLGLTYLDRAKMIVELECVTTLDKRQDLWHDNCFDQRIEFDEGDLGLSGGIQAYELLTKHAKDGKCDDHIQRFPGEASRKLPWPVTQMASKTVDEKLAILDASFSRILKLLRDLMKKKAGHGIAADHQSTISASSISQ